MLQKQGDRSHVCLLGSNVLYLADLSAAYTTAAYYIRIGVLMTTLTEIAFIVLIKEECLLGISVHFVVSHEFSFPFFVLRCS